MVKDALDVLSFIIGESNENFKMKTMANSAGLEINKNRPDWK